MSPNRGLAPRSILAAFHPSWSVPLPLLLPPLLLILLLAAGPPRAPLRPAGAAETFPVLRPLVDLREAAIQTVGRDGPRYPDDGVLATVSQYRRPASSSTSSADGVDCGSSFAVLTMANGLAMEALMPLLLESLHRLQLPPDDAAGLPASTLARHTLVFASNTDAIQACIRLRRRYKNACLSDSYSGLAEGDLRFPDWRFLAYGMAKLKYVINVLSTGTDVLYLDADVVVLQNPFPGLLAASADVAVATAPAPCGTAPRRPDWEASSDWEDAEDHDEQNARDREQDKHQKQEQQEQEESESSRRRELREADPATAGAAATKGGGGAAGGYAPGITFYRATPGVMRCTFSLLLDLVSAVMEAPNATTTTTLANVTSTDITTSMTTSTNTGTMAAATTLLEQEHFAAFMPYCAEVLGWTLTELPPEQYITSCSGGADAGEDAGGRSAATTSGDAVVAVHACGSRGSSLLDRVPLMQRLLGIAGDQLGVQGAVSRGDPGKRDGGGGDGSGGGSGGSDGGGQVADSNVTEALQVV